MKLGEAIKHRKDSITIDDNTEYKLCRVQLHRRGVVLREVLRGVQIKTKKQQVCKAGDFLVAEMDAKVGGYGFVPKELDGAIVSSHYFLFELDEERIRPGFLEVVSKLGILQDQIKATGSTNYAAIRPANVLDWEIPSLDIEHQIDIERLFTKATQKSEELASELTNQISLAKQLRQAFLREAMQGKLVAQDPNDEPASELLKKIKDEKEQLIRDKKIRQGKIQEAATQEEIIFDIPSSWEWCKLDDLCYNITDGTHQTPTYTSTGRTFLSAQNVKPFRFMPEEHKFVSEKAYDEYIRNRKPEKGDLLVARVGAGIGETAVIDRDLDFCFYVSLGLVQPFKNFIDSNYLAYVFNSPYGILYAKGNISSKGGSAGNFNLGRIRAFLIPLPPLPEQQRIVARLEQLMNYCDKLEQSIKQSQTQNEQLLQQVLREALQPSKEYGMNNNVSMAAEPL